MIDTLREILSATKSLGFLELVKVTGTSDETLLNAMAPDKTVVLNSKFLQPVPQLEGIFGLHDLSRLNTILNIPEYKENASITVVRVNQNGDDVPTGISFKNAAGDFKNDYRFMGREVVEIQLPPRNRANIVWDISVVPSLSSIQKLKFQAQAAGSSDNVFKARVENHNLLFSLGDKSTHTGEFIFASGIKGNLKVVKEWPLSQVQAILNMTGDKVLEITDRGAMQITVTTGLAVHQYTVLAKATE